MCKLKILEDEYPGDKAWSDFVSSHEDIDPLICDQLLIDYDLSKVLVGKVGSSDEAKKWLHKDIPALNSLTPYHLLSECKNGIYIIRTLLMRMP